MPKKAAEHRETFAQSTIVPSAELSCFDCWQDPQGRVMIWNARDTRSQRFPLQLLRPTACKRIPHSFKARHPQPGFRPRDKAKDTLNPTSPPLIVARGSGGGGRLCPLKFRFLTNYSRDCPVPDSATSPNLRL